MLGFTRIQNAVKGGKENEIIKAWKDYGNAVYDDEMLKTLSVSSVYLRRPAFDQIKDEKVKAATLAAIKDALNKELKACAAKQGELANFIGEIGNGEDLVAWIKGKNGQTELQNKETFAKMKGRMDWGEFLLFNFPQLPFDILHDFLQTCGLIELLLGDNFTIFAFRIVLKVACRSELASHDVGFALHPRGDRRFQRVRDIELNINVVKHPNLCNAKRNIGLRQIRRRMDQEWS